MFGKKIFKPLIEQEAIWPLYQTIFFFILCFLSLRNLFHQFWSINTELLALLSLLLELKVRTNSDMGPKT